MHSRLLLAAAAWSLLASSSNAAWGAEDEVSPAADAEAQQAYERADALYRARDLAAALREMERSYRLSHRADLLYNLARIEEELGQCPPARDHYRQYLEQLPDGEARGEAERAEERLAARCPDGAAEPVAALSVPAATPPPPPPPAPLARSAPPPVTNGSTQRWLGWSLVAGGVVAGLGAAYFLDSALDSRSAYQASVDREVAGGPFSDPGLLAHQERDERTARVLGVSSAALLLGGAVVVLLAPSPQGGRQAAVQVQPGRLAAVYVQTF
ncbi:MAG: hypothetical protein EOO73_01920 [Myxococcales bacterium]|nr:MAG: hypothetical protein EOO73_01920 [Myxococcales bacterium]